MKYVSLDTLERIEKLLKGTVSGHIKERSVELKYKCPSCGTMCDGSAHKKPNGDDCDMVTTRRGGWRQLGIYDG